MDVGKRMNDSGIVGEQLKWMNDREKNEPKQHIFVLTEWANGFT